MSRLPQGYRRCISCRKLAPRQDLWRVIRLASNGAIALDQGEGRSAYLCPNSDCLAQARRKNRLARALKASIAPSLLDQLAERLGERIPTLRASDPDG